MNGSLAVVSRDRRAADATVAIERRRSTWPPATINKTDVADIWVPSAPGRISAHVLAHLHARSQREPFQRHLSDRVRCTHGRLDHRTTTQQAGTVQKSSLDAKVHGDP